MLPLLRQGKDLVLIQSGKPKKGDVALYEQDESGTCVLHRVLAVKDRVYVFRGDNCVNKEYVPEEFVLGVLTRIWRDGKEIDIKTDGRYRAYSIFWRATAFVRIPYKKLKFKLKKLIKKRRLC